MMKTRAFSWHYLMIILSTIMLLSLQQVMSANRCLSDQRSLLLQLNNSLVFHDSPIYSDKSLLLPWNPSTDCCTWEGVRCQDGLVVGLHLSNKSIVGGLMDNSSLFRFQHLQSLDLSLNDFGIPIPLRFGNLTSLTHLNLSQSGFIGKIPIGISHLTNLVTLDLSLPPWIDETTLKVDHSSWRMLFRNLTKLEQLYLDGVNMSAAGKRWGRLFSTPLPNLRVLSLSGCYLSGLIDPSPLKLQSLSVIDLHQNDLSAPVPRFFANFSKLASLHLSDCGLYGTFPKEIFQVPTLEILDLSSNELLHGSLPEFLLNNSLQNLDLSITSFSGRLPTSITNLTRLSTLNLYGCQFNGTLPNFMLPKLVYLNLVNNIFSGPIPSFRFSKNLKTILLSNISLSGPIPLDHWEGLSKLGYVDLDHNIFNGTLPTSLFRVPSLRIAYLSHNKFDGLIPEFPNAPSSTLDRLDLRDNNLEGPIPTTIFQLKNLRSLDLSFNKLNGTIQLDVVKGLVQLRQLDLSYNNLSVNANATAGSPFSRDLSVLNLASCKLQNFPNLKNHSNLRRLDLSDNQIHGTVPNWIWDLGSGDGGIYYLNLSRNYIVGIQELHAFPSSLETLDLHFNQIRGKIPTIPKSMLYIDLSSNNLSSSIPVDIGNIEDSALYYLSLSDNGITGGIPESICKMDNLQVLDLSSNHLSGRIPECVSTMSNLLVLNLRGNSLSGIIPNVGANGTLGGIITPSFLLDCGLRSLDLNGNSLQGQIPKLLARCTELEVLDLGNNKLIDEFPCFLGNISTLRVLVLRSNEFHGSIGCSHANKTWANLQILDLAHNSFSGELPGHDFTNWNEMMSKVDDGQQKLGHLRTELRYQSYYEDSTTVTIKGQEMHLVRILTIDICIDLSSNNFSGRIPEELGALTLLYVLNLSNNAFSGSIPWSLGKLRSLESLDLSRNTLSGTIPTTLADLNFLSLLDLSFNKLVGTIPSGHQIQTFSADSFRGNQGLWGCPLTKSCTIGGAPNLGTPEHDNQISDSETKIDWNILSAEIGFIVGFGSFIGALVFCKRWRKLYFETMEEAAYRILPLAVTRKWISWTTGR